MRDAIIKLEKLQTNKKHTNYKNYRQAKNILTIKIYLCIEEFIRAIYRTHFISHDHENGY